MTCLRNKRDSLALLDQKGFRPDIIIDIGAAGGTVGLYETWPQSRYVLVEPLSKFAPQLRAICSGLPQADYRIAAAGSGTGRLHIAYHPTEPRVVALAQNAPADWPRDDIEMVTVDQLVAEDMTSSGYYCFDIIEPLFRPGDNILWQVDLVFVRRDSGLRSLFTYQLSS